jgi:hypothetical protein
MTNVRTVPEGKQFPRLNDAAEFRVRIRRGVLIVWTVALTVPGSWSWSWCGWFAGGCRDSGDDDGLHARRRGKIGPAT